MDGGRRAGGSASAAERSGREGNGGQGEANGERNVEFHEAETTSGAACCK